MGLNYAGARYYEPTRGVFISQDPVALTLGDQSALEAKTNIQQATYLRNPQTHHSYAYAANNPVKFVDQDGEYIQMALGLLAPNVAGAPDIGQETTVSQKYEQAILLAGVLSPSGKVKAVANNASKATYSVYQGLDGSKAVKYVGITSRNPVKRFDEHLKSVGTGKDLLRYQALPGTGNLTRDTARIMEQGLINRYGLSKNGGQLLNKINSISINSSLYRSVQSSSKRSALRKSLSSLSRALKSLSARLK